MPEKELTPKQFRSKIASELEQFAAVLLAERVCADASEFYKASSVCQSHTGDEWGYSISALTLQVGDSVKCIPTHIRRFVCRLDVSIEGSWRKRPPQSDPLQKNQVQIELRAENGKNPGMPFLQAWHFDRHPSSCSIPKTAHPRYHFSVGGHRVKAHLKQIGKVHFDGVLLLDTPRLTHPPLDGILAIDFVLSHFSGTDWRRLSQHPDYQRLVNSSLSRLWKPYALALCAHWSTDHAAKAVWPIAELWPPAI